MSHKILSKNVLGMKFMQRTKEKIEQKKEVEETIGHRVEEEKGMKPEIEVWPTEDSFVACQELSFGRMSFRGYNPEIERLMIEKDPKFQRRQEGQVDSDEEEISAKEMADKFLQMNPSRAGQVKRKRNQYISREEDDD